MPPQDTFFGGGLYMEPGGGLGRHELGMVLFILIFLALVVGAIMITVGTPEVRTTLAELLELLLLLLTE